MHTIAESFIALDVGERRIGLARASTIARLAEPFGHILRSDTTIEELLTIFEREGAKAIIVGLPRGLAGQETDQTRAVRAFAAELERATNRPIHFQDEALTSKQAETELSARKARYNKADIDALAATYILDDFLNTETREGKK